MTTLHGQIIPNMFQKRYLKLLFQIKSYLSLHHIVFFYSAYIKPYFGYCCVIKGNSFNSNENTIEKVQRRVSKLILGTDYNHWKMVENKYICCHLMN